MYEHSKANQAKDGVVLRLLYTHGQEVQVV